MTTKQTALAVIDSSAYPVLRDDAQGAVLAMQENLGDTDISPFDLDVITVPSGGGLAWVVPSLTGDESKGALEGIIVHQGPTRGFWKESFDDSGGGTPPDCVSVDGRVGVGSPGGECASCVLNEWGSARGKDGEPKRGKACQERRLVFLLREHQFMPILINVPPSSLGVIAKLMLRLTSKGVPFYNVVVRFELERDKSAGGITFSKIVVSVVGMVEAEDQVKLAKYRDAIVPSLRAVKLEAEDFEATA